MEIFNGVQNITPWLLSSGIKIFLILIIAFLANRFFRIFLEKAIIKQIKNRVANKENKKQAKTLISIFSGIIKFIVWITALLMILPEFGVNIVPILTGLGLLGLAVGMAAKGIISDFISGLFIFLENQYHIGDKVKITGVEGYVMEITLRRTIIKDETGLVYSIPNGQIKTVAKKAKRNLSLFDASLTRVLTKRER